MHSHYITGISDDVIGSEVVTKFNTGDCSFSEQFNALSCIDTIEERLILL